MNVHSLETERQHILERMHAQRENYRRALINGDDISDVVVGTHMTDTTHAPRMHRISTYAPVRKTSSRGPVMRVLTEHPLLCALGVAAVIAIGPKRIARKVMTGGAALNALTTRSQSNIDMIGRLLTLAGSYVQDRTSQKPRR